MCDAETGHVKTIHQARVGRSVVVGRRTMAVDRTVIIPINCVPCLGSRAA